MARNRNLIPKGKLEMLSWTSEKLSPLTKDEVRRVLKEVEVRPLDHLLINFL
ncbi:MAG: hypothetical protein HYW01_06455 [Deltaproteobacteria bacterium]|nr:hypothetical protein [Deltaproteobacteria bacterium]